MEAQNKVFVKREFNCSKTELFNWLIQPDLIVKWFGPQKMNAVKAETDVRVGGDYFIEMRRGDKDNFFMKGKYIEIEAPNMLAYTVQYVGLQGSPPKSTVKMLIEELETNRAQLTLIQSFTIMPSDMEKRTVAWEYMFDKLVANLE